MKKLLLVCAMSIVTISMYGASVDPSRNMLAQTEAELRMTFTALTELETQQLAKMLVDARTGGLDHPMLILKKIILVNKLNQHPALHVSKDQVMAASTFEPLEQLQEQMNLERLMR